MPTDKKELRARLKQVRVALPAADRQAKSAAISHRLKDLIDWQTISKLHCFEPLSRLQEVDLSAFMATLRSEHPDLQVYTSRLINGAWKIVDRQGNLTELELVFDAMIVPMLGFDAELHRIGYGGGYYDRLLSVQPQAAKIGVCFEQGRLDRLPTEPHDIAMDMIVTEMSVYAK